jgi:PncC family amidohydrolase
MHIKRGGHKLRKEEFLNEDVGALLVDRSMTVSLAESCTGGQVMKHLSDVPGSSRYLAGGVVAYSNDLKINLLGVPRAVIERHGAVSEPTARLMAEGVKKVTGTSLGVGITGIAGPGGGTAEKPTGLVYIALAGAAQTLCQRFVFPGPRAKVRDGATSASLNMLRQYLLGFMSN